MSRSRLRVLALATAVTAGVVYWGGHDRPFSTDEWLTVREYVRAPGILDAFRSALIWNNHPLFTFLERLLAGAIGSSTPAVMRVLPVAFAACAVGVFAFAALERLGTVAGSIATVFFAANPLWLGVAKLARGYSLLVLLSIVATIVLCRLRTRPSLRLEVAYILASGLAIATHLYAVLVIAGHVAVVAGERRLDHRWIVRWTCVAALGAAAYVAQFGQLPLGSRGRDFMLDFPLDVGRELLGRRVAVVIAGVPFVLVAMRSALSKTSGRVVATAYAAVFVAVWTAGSVDLYPRFFVWAVPATAWAVGAGVAAAVDAIASRRRARPPAFTR